MAILDKLNNLGIALVQGNHRFETAMSVNQKFKTFVEQAITDAQQSGSNEYLMRLLAQFKTLEFVDMKKGESKVNVVLPKGFLGKGITDNVVENFLRAFAVQHSQGKGEYAEKYGTTYRNENIVMQPFCWCEKKDCPYCFDDEALLKQEWVDNFGAEKNNNGDVLAPNFWYKPLDFKVWWYKYIGRSVVTNKTLSQEEFEQMQKDCLN